MWARGKLGLPHVRPLALCAANGVTLRRAAYPDIVHVLYRLDLTPATFHSQHFMLKTHDHVTLRLLNLGRVPANQRGFDSHMCYGLGAVGFPIVWGVISYRIRILMCIVVYKTACTCIL